MLQRKEQRTSVPVPLSKSIPAGILKMDHGGEDQEDHGDGDGHDVVVHDGVHEAYVEGDIRMSEALIRPFHLMILFPNSFSDIRSTYGMGSIIRQPASHQLCRRYLQDNHVKRKDMRKEIISINNETETRSTFQLNPYENVELTHATHARPTEKSSAT
jgi:hypothetical protein